VASVKFQCLEVASNLVAKLHTHFPSHELHEALGIVHPHYWLFKKFDESFNTRLNVLNAFFCTPKKIGVVEHVVFEVLCGYLY
jgi:hypothetical protein